MKNNSRILHSLLLILTFTSLCATLVACNSKEEKEPQPDLYEYPWVDYPQSYIKFFDYRMQFRMLDVKWNGSALEIDYTLTNVGFGKEVTLTFYLNRDAAHDDFGNTYTNTASISDSDVAAYINGQAYGIAGNGKQVSFMPNQTIKGSFMIKNFDPNARSFSLSVNVERNKPSDITLAYDRIDFVNIPVPAKENGDSEFPML